MNIRNLRHVAVAATLAATALTSRADAVTTTQPLALPTPSLALVQTSVAPEVQLLGTHYRPRGSGYRGSAGNTSVSQIHIGYFDPDGDPSSRFLVGIRGGPMIDKNIQLGVGVDWAHKTEKASSVSHSEIGPGGTPIEVRTDLSSASTHFFPMMAFVQVSADDDMPIVPFFGVAGGYQVLNLSAENYQTGDTYDGTFGGWGWQIWGGAALPLSGRTRVTGEIYVNGGELTRDVDEVLGGGTYRESVNADGMGLRMGLAWGF
ncbi:MAG: hypothetical protein IT348_07205 [Candidatus Eisenbacteria bacterium]|nr:hypothetical protein [Candidatus Eisenbacteria bacterium]